MEARGRSRVAGVKLSDGENQEDVPTCGYSRPPNLVLASDVGNLVRTRELDPGRVAKNLEWGTRGLRSEGGTRELRIHKQVLRSNESDKRQGAGKTG